jgi:UDP-glucose 4-epimerase
MMYGIKWPGDVKRITLKIDKMKRIGFKPSMSSKEAVKTTVRKLLEEISAEI